MEFQWMASTTPGGLQEMQRERSKSLLGLRMSNPGSVFWGITVRVQATKTDRQRKNSSGEVQEGQAPHLHLSSHFQIPNSVWVACEGQREIPVTMAEPQTDRCKGNTFLSIQGCIHGQELNPRAQKDTANFSKYVYRVHSVLLLGLYNPNLSTDWTSAAGFRFWPHLVQKMQTAPANTVWIYKPIIHRWYGYHITNIRSILNSVSFSIFPHLWDTLLCICAGIWSNTGGKSLAIANYIKVWRHQPRTSQVLFSRRVRASIPWAVA